MIRIDALRMFLVVAESGTLRDAAAQLNRTQSALSMALKQLEEHLGGPLFETDRKRNLTALGRFVRDVATGMVAEHDHTIALIERYARGRAGQLRLASVPSVAAVVLPAVLLAFLRRADGAEIDLADTDSTSVRRRVAAGQADIGIASGGTCPEGLRAEFLFSDWLVLVCHADHPLAHHPGKLGWADISSADLIMHGALDALEASAFRAIATKSRLSVRNNLSLLAMVKSGAGITLLPSLATRSLDPALVTRRIDAPGLARQVYLVTRAERSLTPLARAFRDHVFGQRKAIAAHYGLGLEG